MEDKEAIGEDSGPRAADPARYFELTLERYTEARTQRFHYLVLYGVIFFVWAGMRTVETRGVQISDSYAYAIVAWQILLQILFMIRFTSVLWTMEFPLFWVILLCLVTIPPVPGLLILVVVDRRIFKVLFQAGKLFNANAPAPDTHQT